MSDGDRRDAIVAVMVVIVGAAAWVLFRFEFIPVDVQRWAFPILFGLFAIDRVRRIAEFLDQQMLGPAILNGALGALSIVVAVTFLGVIFEWPQFSPDNTAAILRPTWPLMAATWMLFVRQYRHRQQRDVTIVDAFLDGQY